MVAPRKILILSLCFSLLVVSGFFIMLTSVGGGHPAVSEPDQTIYLQYARNMALGHPYVFSPGDPPSSGSTTHLYIAILALPYRLGAHGDLFLHASFILNAGFYLGIIGLIWLIAKKLVPKALALVMLLSVLSGHLASAVLKQTDIGLFILLALGLFAALIHGHRIMAAMLVAACAITRPEGMVFSLAFAMCGLASMVWCKYLGKTKTAPENAGLFLLLGVIGGIAFAATLLINYKTTGYFQFMSVANKGYFNKFPPGGAIILALNDLLSLVKGVFAGLQESNRQFYLLPVVSGLLGVAGILLHGGRSKSERLLECWLGLSVLGALLLVASSQFQGVSNDRYLGWIMPFWIIYVSMGWHELSKRIPEPRAGMVLAAALVLYQPISLAYIASDTYWNAVYLQREYAFAKSIGEKFPASTRFCITDGAGLNYFMPNHKVYNPHGITSPGFFQKSSVGLEKTIDLLKHHPELRFEYWIITDEFIRNNGWIRPFVGNKAMEDTDTALITDNALRVYEATWDTIETGHDPHLMENMLENLEEIDRLDIGYHTDEDAHDYTAISRMRNTFFTPIATTGKLGEKMYSETGRTIHGSESFMIRNIQPGHPVTLILRTGRTAEGLALFGKNVVRNSKTNLKNELALHLLVDGEEVPCHPVRISENGFSEVALVIPGDRLSKTTAKIELVGDHISYAYWFYQ